MSRAQSGSRPIGPLFLAFDFVCGLVGGRWPGSVKCRFGRIGKERGLWVLPTLATDRTDLDVAASPCRDN
jgi:hypothetical protein